MHVLLLVHSTHYARALWHLSRGKSLTCAREVWYSASMKKTKNPYAVALGRRGGKKGGKARMLALTPEERSELGRKAAQARWNRAKAAKRARPAST